MRSMTPNMTLKISISATSMAGDKEDIDPEKKYRHDDEEHKLQCDSKEEDKLIIKKDDLKLKDKGRRSTNLSTTLSTTLRRRKSTIWRSMAS